MDQHDKVKLASQAKTLVSGWRVEATWYAHAATPELPLSSGPEEVRIQLTDDADPAVRARGITSGVLRAIELSIKEMAADLSASAAAAERYEATGKLTAGEVMQVRLVENLVRDLRDHQGRGPKPRDYYRRLLKVRETLEEDPRITNPVALMASALKVPVATVRTQLHTAKKLDARGRSHA